MLEQKKQLSSKVSQLEDEVQYLEKSQLTISNKSRALDLPPKSSLQSVSHSGVIVTNDNYSTKIHDFEDRIKSMIIQALNEKPPFPTLNSHRKYDQNLSQEIKNNKRKEKNEENSTQMSNENDNACDTNWRQSDGKLKNRCNDNFGALYNNEHQSPKNHSTKKTSEKIHDKKPLLMTLKIDRKANSAVVKECNSPNDSHSRTNDVKYKRKSNSDEMHSSRKKSSKSPSTSPKHADNSRRPSVVIKFGGSVQNNEFEKNDGFSKSGITAHDNKRREIDAVNRKLDESIPVINGKHKWKQSIDSGFDKLLALAENKMESHKQIDSLNCVKEVEFKNNYLQKNVLKRNSIPEQIQNSSIYTEISESHLNHINSNLSNKLNSGAKTLIKSPPDTPPRTPSPSASIERPLTPHTPGISPASTPTIIMNAQNDRSSLVSPACSTSSKASSIDSHCSKQKSGKSGRSKHKTNHAIPVFTANHNPVSQTSSLSSHVFNNNCHSINIKDCSHSSQSQSQQLLGSHQMLPLSKSLSSRTSPMNTLSSLIHHQRNGKSAQFYPNMLNTQNEHFFKSFSSIESNQRHSNYPNAVSGSIDYHSLSQNDIQSVPSNCNISPLIHTTYTTGPTPNSSSMASNATQYSTTNQTNQFRAQFNGQNSLNYGQQQKLLRPSKLDAVLKDYTGGQTSPDIETGIFIFS
jgi:hypothetical protein